MGFDIGRVATGLATGGLSEVGRALKGSKGSNDPVTQTSTQYNMPSYVQDEAEKIWNDWYAKFTGSATNPSYEQKYKADLDFVKGADLNYTQALQAMMDDIAGQARTGTGYYKPISFGFGGNQMASFVPKQNRELANELLNMGKQRAGLDLVYDTKHTPYEADQAYTDYMKDLAFALNVDKSPTTTATGEASVPEESWLDALLKVAPSIISVAGAA